MKHLNLTRLAVFLFIVVSYFATTSSPCDEIFSLCWELNPYDPFASQHGYQSWTGYAQGCLNFFSACKENL